MFQPQANAAEKFNAIIEYKATQLKAEISKIQYRFGEKNMFENCHIRLTAIFVEITKLLHFVTFCELKPLEKMLNLAKNDFSKKTADVMGARAAKFIEEFNKNDALSKSVFYRKMNYRCADWVAVFADESAEKMREKFIEFITIVNQYPSECYQDSQEIEQIIQLSDQLAFCKQKTNKIKACCVQISSARSSLEAQFVTHLTEQKYWQELIQLFKKCQTSENVVEFASIDQLTAFSEQIEKIKGKLLLNIKSLSEMQQKLSQNLSIAKRIDFSGNKPIWSQIGQYLSSVPSNVKIDYSPKFVSILESKIEQKLHDFVTSQRYVTVNVTAVGTTLDVTKESAAVFEMLIASPLRSEMSNSQFSGFFENEEAKKSFEQTITMSIHKNSDIFVQKAVSDFNCLTNRQNHSSKVLPTMISIENSISAFRSLRNSSSISDFSFFHNVLQSISKVKEDIQFIPDTENGESFIFDYADLKRTLFDRHQLLAKEVCKLAKAEITQGWVALLSFIKINKSLLINCTVAEKKAGMTEAKKFEDFFAINAAVATSQQTVDGIEALQSALSEHETDEETEQISDLNFKKWNDFIAIFEIRKREIETETSDVSSTLAQRFEPFSEEFECIYKAVLTLQLTSDAKRTVNKQSSTVYELYNRWNTLLTAAGEELKLMKQFGHIFEEKLAQMSEIETFFDKDVGEWKLLFTFMEKIAQFINKPWLEARFELANFETLVGEFSLKKASEVDLQKALHSVTHEWLQKIKILYHIVGEDYTPKYWKRLCDVLSIDKSFQDLTAKLITESHKFGICLEELENLRLSAKGEQTVLKLLDETEFALKAVEFEFKNYDSKHKVANRQIQSTNEQGKAGFMIFDHLEKVSDLISEKTAILFSLQGNPYSNDCADKIDLLRHKYAILEELIALIKVAQQRWCSLHPIMTSDFIKRGKKTENLKFAAASDSLSGIISAASVGRTLHYLVHLPDATQTLTKCIATFEQLQKSLFEFLEVKRIEFARFYFLGDLDLIEFLGDCQSIDTINFVLPKFFPAAKTVQTAPNQKEIIGIDSELGEPLALSQPVAITNNAQQWLSNLLSVLQNSIEQNVTKTVSASELLITSLPTDNEQAVLIARWAHFCRLASDQRQLTNLREVLQTSIKNISVLKPEQPCKRSLKKSLLLTCIYQLDLVKTFETTFKESKNYTESLAYYSVLKYLYRKGEKLICEVGSYRTEYSFEYLGNTPKLVQTPLTDKCFLTMSSAMLMGLGGNPCGPAGTGKTETVKALGNAFGRLVVVFNCDEMLEFKTMCRLFIGIVGSGAWGCFDEFNRLAVKELSAISQVISQIQTRQKMRDESKVEINGTEVRVLSTVGIFITLNPVGNGYKGRNKLPKNLQVLFRSLAMTHPNKLMITRISFICIAFEFDFADLASKFIVELFDSAAKILDLERCYDWGLRGLKTLVAQTEAYLEALGPSTAMPDTQNKDKLRNIQKECLKRAIETNIIAKLQDADRSIFNALLKESWKVFDNDLPVKASVSSAVETPIAAASSKADSIPEFTNESEQQFSKEVRNSLKDLNLLELDSQVRMCVQMRTIIDQRIGFGIIGKSGNGKSTLLAVLKHSLERCGKRVKLSKFYAKSMSKNDLFGCYSKDQIEFTDGLFVKVLRESLAELNNGSCDCAWIVFEGDIDPTWAENLNSALDDNSLFTLPTGERFYLPNKLKIIFESTDLDQASMASISRIGLLVCNISEQDSRLINEQSQTIVKDKEITEFSKICDIPSFLAVKNAENSRLTIVLNNEEEHHSRLLANMQTEQFFSNKNSTIDDLMKVITKAANQSANGHNTRMKSGARVVLRINDLDMVRPDQFGTRLIEQFLCQVLDHGWYYHAGKLIKTANFEIQLALMSENSLSKISKRLLNRASFSETLIARLTDKKTDTKLASSITLDCYKQVFQIHNQNSRRSSLTMNEFELCRQLSQKSRALTAKELDDLFGMSQDSHKQMNTNHRASGDLRSKRPRSRLAFWKSCDFYKGRFHKLISALRSDKISHVLFACQPDSFAEECAEYACELSGYETKRFSNTADFDRQIFEIMEDILAAKQIVWLVDERSCQFGDSLSKLDSLANYEAFSLFCEEFRAYSGRSTDTELQLNLYQKASNFKILMLWNITHENEFEELLGSYSCFTRKFTTVLDDPLTEFTLKQQMKALLSGESEDTVMSFMKSINSADSPAQVEAFVSTFKKLRAAKLSDLQLKLDKFESGSQKIKAIEEQARLLSDKIQEEKQAMATQQKDLDLQMERISLASVEVDSQKILAEKLRKGLENEQKELAEKKILINSQLEAAAPMVEEAKARIKSLSKSNIDELRNYHIPPEVVLDIFGVLLKLMNEPDASWNNMKKLLGKRTVIEQIVEIDPRDIDRQQLKEVEAILLKKPDSFNRDRVAKVSVAAAPIADFIKAIVNFVKTVLNIKPLEEEYKALDGDIKISEARMVEAQAKVEEFLGKQRHLKKSLASKSLEIEECKMRIVQTEEILALATKLFANLQSEGKRWLEQLNKLTFRKGHIEQYSLATAYYLVYLTKEEQQTAAKLFEKMAVVLQLPPEFSLQEFLLSHEILGQMIEHGHPENEHALANTYAFKEVNMSFLILDPENRMSAYFSKSFGQVESLTTEDSKFGMKYELFVKLGKTVHVTAQRLPNDDLISITLMRKVTFKSNKGYITWGDKLIDWNPKFRLLLTVKEPFAHGTAISTPHLLNYTASKLTIEEELLSVIIDWKNPKLEADKQFCLLQKQKVQTEVYLLEDNLLQLMANSQSNLLEDKKLFAALDEIKTKSDIQKTTMSQLNETLLNLNKQRETFKSEAEKITTMFQVIVSMGKLDSGSAYSLEFLKNRMRVKMQELSPNVSVSELVKDLTDTLCYEVGLAMDDETRIVFLLVIVQELKLISFKNEKSINLTDTIINPELLLSDTKSLKNIDNQLLNLIKIRKEAPEDFETQCLIFLKTIFPSNAFSKKSKIEWLLQQSFSQTIIIIDTNSTKLFDQTALETLCQTLPIVLNCMVILIGTMSSSVLYAKLVELCEKPAVVVLQGIHTHYDSFNVILSFYSQYSGKFNARFKLILTTETTDNLPPNLFENSLKILISQTSSFEQNLENAIETCNVALGPKPYLAKLSRFHSIVLERAKYIPIGWSKDYETSDFELKCAIELFDKLSSKTNEKMLNSLVLDVLYLTKLDHEADCEIMERIFKLEMGSAGSGSGSESGQLPLTATQNQKEQTNSKSIYDQTYLQNSALKATKKRLTESICEKLQIVCTGLQQKRHEIAHQIKQSTLEKFSEFWGAHEQKFRWQPRSQSRDPLFASFIDSEYKVYRKLVRILDDIQRSVEQYLSGRIKMKDVLFGDDISQGRVPIELSEIYDASQNLFEYLDWFVKLTAKLRLNFDNLTAEKMEIDLSGIICHKKIFEVLKIKIGSQTLTKHASNRCQMSIVPTDKADCLFIISSVEGGVFSDQGRLVRTLETVKNDKITPGNRMVLGVKFTKIKTEDIAANMTMVPLLSDNRRLKHVANFVVEAAASDHEYFKLSATALLIN